MTVRVHNLWGCSMQKNPKFKPKKSSTYHSLSCDEPQCDGTSEEYSCSSEDVCSYKYSYLDGSQTQGLVAKETITLTSSISGKPVSFKNVVFGCGHNNSATQAPSRMKWEWLDLELGYMSFVYQTAPHVGGRKFSHCFVPLDPNHPSIASKMSFGNGSAVSSEGVVSTPLMTKEDSFQYFVTVDGISVGDEFVSSNSPETMLLKGIMFLDSGTQVMTVPQDFYDRLIAQVKATVDPSLKPIYLNDYPNPRDGTLLCYNTTMKNLKGPTLTVHFDGGDKVELKLQQTFFQRQQPKLLCFSVMNDSASTDDGVCIYGSYVQSNL